MSTEQLDGWIIGQTADALIFADCDGVIRRWNAAASRVFGFDAAEALGQSLDLIIPKHLRESHWRGFDAAIASGKLKLSGQPTLTRGLHKDGHKIYVEMTFALVADEQGQVLGSVSVARDVTERVAQEKASRSS